METQIDSADALGSEKRDMSDIQILCIAGPTASGKSARAIKEALGRNGEIISVDSRQVYRSLDIGTEKILSEDMCGIPHHLINIREPYEAYSAGEFASDARELICNISSRGKLPILVGGTHFYFNALLHNVPKVEINKCLREKLEMLSTSELYEQVCTLDARRAKELDRHNRRRLIRALEIIDELGSVPARNKRTETELAQNTRVRSFNVEWIIINPPRDDIRERINTRLKTAIENGLVKEVECVRESLIKHFSYDNEKNAHEKADARLNELGLEYKIIGEYLRGECDEASIIPTLSAKLWQYAKHQKAWLRKLHTETIAT